MDPDTGLLASNKLVARHNPAKNQRWYFEQGFPDQYKNIFTSTNLPRASRRFPPEYPDDPGSRRTRLIAQAEQFQASPQHQQGWDHDGPYLVPRVQRAPRRRNADRAPLRRRSLQHDPLGREPRSSRASLGLRHRLRRPTLARAETLTSDIVFENFQIKDYYVNRIDAYLQSIGASPGLYAGNWQASRRLSDGRDDPPPVADLHPRATRRRSRRSSLVQQTHNGSDTLYQKIQGYLYKPGSTLGPLGPQNCWIVPQDADFFRRLHSRLPPLPHLRRSRDEPVRHARRVGASNTEPERRD